jgi:O-antigen ligase
VKPFRARLEDLVAVCFCASLVLGDGLALGLHYVVLACLLAGLIQHRRFALLLPLQSWLILYASFLAWAALSVGFGGHGVPRSGEATLPLSWAALAICVLFFRDVGRTQRALNALAVATVVVCFFSFAQYAFDMSRVGVWLRVPAARLDVPAPGDLSHTVASGFFFNRLKLAFCLAATLPLLAFSWRSSAASKIVVCTLSIIAIALTFSRSAMVAAALGLFMGALVRRRVDWRWLAAIVVLLPFGLLAPALCARLASIFATASYADRGFIWARALEMRRAHPLFGIGFGNYPRVCGAYYDAVDATFPMRTHAHNQWLSILVETGPLGLALFCALWTSVVFLVWQTRKSAHFPAAVAILTCAFVLMLVHDPLQHSATALALSAALGIALAQRE